jgi:hypothetical protein
MKFPPLYLLNVILPFFFFELQYVLIAFVFVVLVETTVVCLFIKEPFPRLFRLMAFVNVLTTLLGYCLQAVIRFIIGLVSYIALNIHTEDPFIAGLFGNVGFRGEKASVLTTVLTSMIITFFISILVETRSLIKKLDSTNSTSRITIGVLVANFVSYSGLFCFVYLNYLSYL